jgi:sulfate transport system ATP-binding protein
VVMNDGRIEQTGAPRDLYDHPKTEFVMGFVGPVNRRGALFIRPHDLEILQVPALEAEEAMIERIVHLGFEARVELMLADGEQLWAQMTLAEAELMELTQGQIVYVRPRRAKVFEPDSDPRTDELVAA